jgi:hypothetical protein
MYISRSLLASAIVLSFSSLSEASVLRRDPNGDAPRLQRRWSLPSLFGKRQGGVETLQCPDSSFQEMLNANPEDRVQSFCNDWLNIQPTTVVVEYTPTRCVFFSSPHLYCLPFWQYFYHQCRHHDHRHFYHSNLYN